MKYKAHFPMTGKNSPFSVTVRDTLMNPKEEEALWHYNNHIEHDGYSPVGDLPAGTTFEPLH